MTFLFLIVLGIVQGLTEFLPVSSSGHLSILQNLFHWNESQQLSFTAFLHLGTTLALLFYFRNQIYQIIKRLFRNNRQRQESVSFVYKIIIGTIPIIIIALLFKDKIEQIFNAPLTTAILLIVNGIILLLTRFTKEKKDVISYSDALLVGIAQAIAILPGISRSGATISIALLLGLTRKDGFEFSFLLSIPAIIGANILMFKDISMNFDIINLLTAIIIPFSAGLLALKLLKNLVTKKQFHYFAYYCWILGIIAIIYFIFL